MDQRLSWSKRCDPASSLYLLRHVNLSIEAHWEPGNFFVWLLPQQWSFPYKIQLVRSIRVHRKLKRLLFLALTAERKAQPRKCPSAPLSYLIETRVSAALQSRKARDRDVMVSPCNGSQGEGCDDWDYCVILRTSRVSPLDSSYLEK